jgi:hypothetical protein
MYRIRWTAPLLVFLALCPSLFAQKYMGEYAVIVNPKNPAQSISSSELKRLVLGEERFWTGRIPVSVIMQDERSVELEFVMKKLLNMSQGEYREHWSAMIFRGQAVSEPVTVPSNGLASGLVAVQEGAICVIRADNVPKNDSVKVLRIDGKSPGDPGYSLHW